MTKPATTSDAVSRFIAAPSNSEASKSAFAEIIASNELMKQLMEIITLRTLEREAHDAREEAKSAEFNVISAARAHGHGSIAHSFALSNYTHAVHKRCKAAEALSNHRAVNA